MPFVKLDCDITTSSLWSESKETRLTFITMLAMAGPQGFVGATAPGIARFANLDLDEVRVALGVLESPDPDSRDKTEGQRVKQIEGGYQVLNYLRYRDKDHTSAERKRRQREREKSHRDTVTVTPVTRDVTQAEAEAEVRGREQQQPRANPLMGDRASIESDVLQLLQRIGELENADPVEILEAESRTPNGASANNPSSMGDDWLLKTRGKLRTRVEKADHDAKRAEAQRRIEASRGKADPEEELWHLG